VPLPSEGKNITVRKASVAFPSWLRSRQREPRRRRAPWPWQAGAFLAALLFETLVFPYHRYSERRKFHHVAYRRARYHFTASFHQAHGFLCRIMV